MSDNRRLGSATILDKIRGWPEGWVHYTLHTGRRDGGKKEIHQTHSPRHTTNQNVKYRTHQNTLTAHYTPKCRIQNTLEVLGRTRYQILDQTSSWRPFGPLDFERVAHADNHLHCRALQGMYNIHCIQCITSNQLFMKNGYDHLSQLVHLFFLDPWMAGHHLPQCPPFTVSFLPLFCSLSFQLQLFVFSFTIKKSFLLLLRLKRPPAIVMQAAKLLFCVSTTGSLFSSIFYNADKEKLSQFPFSTYNQIAPLSTYVEQEIQSSCTLSATERLD